MKSVRIFISYSHNDRRWIDDPHDGLVEWLRKTFVGLGTPIELWFDHELRKLPGEIYKTRIKSEIAAADIVVLLVSMDFISSEFVSQHEMPLIQELHGAGKLIVVPILVRPLVTYNLDRIRWITDLQMLPGLPTPLIDIVKDESHWERTKNEIFDAVSSRIGELHRRREGVTQQIAAPPEAQTVPIIQAAPHVVTTSTNPIDGAEMVWVPAGEFTMGSADTDRDVGDDQKPAHKVYLGGYWIYKTDVTVAQYNAFCEAAGRTKPRTPEFGWHDDHPVVNVSWDDAAAYAKWAGASLPTEAQWEKAARGTDSRRFPWGNDWDPSLCVHSHARPGDRGSTEAVGSYPQGASPFGALDMAGNVWNWCADYYGEHYYRMSPNRNPAGPVSGDCRVLRGGSWHYFKEMYFRVSYRFSNVPVYTSYNIGFRCVMRG